MKKNNAYSRVDPAESNGLSAIESAVSNVGGNMEETRDGLMIGAETSSFELERGIDYAAVNGLVGDISHGGARRARRAPAGTCSSGAPPRLRPRTSSSTRPRSSSTTRAATAARRMTAARSRCTRCSSPPPRRRCCCGVPAHASNARARKCYSRAPGLSRCPSVCPKK